MQKKVEDEVKAKYLKIKDLSLRHDNHASLKCEKIMIECKKLKGKITINRMPNWASKGDTLKDEPKLKPTLIKYLSSRKWQGW